MTDRFVLNDLPNGTWSVCWAPGFEFDIDRNPDKVLTLLEIMFEIVGVDEAMIGVQQPGRDNDWQTLHISSLAWLEKGSREQLARRISEYVIPGVRFTDVYQAKKFIEHMEKRLMWSRLGNGIARYE